jgi:hypothetical protein
MKIKYLFMAMLALAIASPRAHAYYVGGSLGSTFVKHSGTAYGTAYPKKTYTGNSASMFIGTDLSRNFSIDLETASYEAGKSGTTISTTGFSVNAYAALPLGTIRPYIGIGTGHYRQETGKDSLVARSNGKLMPQYTAGISVKPADWKVALGLQYRRIDGKFKYEVAGTDGETDDKIHDIAMTLRYDF